MVEVFTARYELIPYIKQITFVFKSLVTGVVQGINVQATEHLF